MTKRYVSRRRLLAAVGVTGSLAGCSGPVSEIWRNSSSDTELTGDYEITEFVDRNGSSLELNGNTYRYNGMMALDLTRLNKGKAWINTVMNVAEDYDIDVFRCWGFSNKEKASHQSPGEFDDTWLELFDYTLAKAKEVGVRLIVPLLQGVHVDSSNEELAFAPSPAAYKIWSETTSASRGTKNFIEDEQANEYYKEYIHHFLTRENQYTGIEYRNESTILVLISTCG